jgi:hypothetical protein
MKRAACDRPENPEMFLEFLVSSNIASLANVLAVSPGFLSSGHSRKS